MVTGINENVEVLGRVFHIQTELTPGEEPNIRTVVFFEGRVIGSRSKQLTCDLADDDEIRAQIKVQQAQILDNFMTRAAALAADKGIDADVEPARSAEAAGPRPADINEPPDAAADPKLVEALTVRRVFTTFQSAIPSQSNPGPDNIEHCLRIAAREIRIVTEAPVFTEVRLDEQVAFHDLKTRIVAELSKPLNMESAGPLWTELVRFAGYLSRINRRAELVSYDRKLFLWALAEIGRNGVSDRVLVQLKNATGRSDALDQLLFCPEDVSAEQWMEVIKSLVEQSAAEGADSGS